MSVSPQKVDNGMIMSRVAEGYSRPVVVTQSRAAGEVKKSPAKK